MREGDNEYNLKVEVLEEAECHPVESFVAAFET